MLNLLKKLAALADHIDTTGSFEQANEIDNIVASLTKKADELSTYRQMQKDFPVLPPEEEKIWIDITDLSSSIKGPMFFVDVTGYKAKNKSGVISNYDTEAIPTKRFEGSAAEVDAGVTNYLLQLQKNQAYDIGSYKHFYPVAKKDGALEWGSKAIQTPTPSTQ